MLRKRDITYLPLDQMAYNFASSLHIPQQLLEIQTSCKKIEEELLRPVKEINSVERGDYLSILTYLQFRHPPYARALETLKQARPDCPEINLGQQMTADLQIILRPYIPMEVSFIDCSKTIGVGVTTRLVSGQPSQSVYGFDIGFYYIKVTETSERDRNVLIAKGTYHNMGPAVCLNMSLNMIINNPVSMKSHKKSRSLSLFKSLRTSE